MRYIRISLFGLFIFFFSFGLLTAKDVGGRFGIGGQTTLGGVHGISVRTYFSPTIGIDGTLGFSFESPADSDDDNETVFALSVRALFNVVQRAQTNLMIIGGLNFQNDSRYEDSVTFGLEGGLGVEHFFSDNFAVHTEAGLVIEPVHENDKRFGTDNAFYISSDVFGSAGFVFYF